MNKVERIKELTKELNRLTELYDKGTPEISDKEWDDMYFELANLERECSYIMSDSPTQKVNYTVVNELQKVKHNHPMLSLDKTKSLDDVLRFIRDEVFVVMPKMDGLTCSIRYLGGKIISAETRGDGEIGESVLHNIITVKNLPQQIDYKDELIVDGEIIIADDDFQKINNNLPDGEKYKNSRNLASGSIRQLDSRIAAQRNMRFIAWKCITPIHKEHQYNNSFIWRLNCLSELGFETVEYCIDGIKPLLHLDKYRQNNITDGKIPLQDIINYIRQWARNKGYPIDGCVFGYEDIAYGDSLGATGHHLRSQYAYKFYDELYETKLIDIEWTVGKTNTLTPTAVFETVNIDGTDINKASLHNISIIKKLGLTNNCTVRVYKANQIIPQIDSCIQDGDSPIEIPKCCPVCGSLTEVVKENESEVLICTNSNCSGKLLGRLKFFVSKPAINIEGLSEQTLYWLIVQGWVRNFKDIYHLQQYRDKWINFSCYGKKSVDNLLNAIEKSRNTTLGRFICALSIDGVGKSASKIISDAFNGDFVEFINAFDNSFDWTTLTDVGDITAQNINEYLAKNESEIRELAKEFNFILPTKVEVKDSAFMGKTLCVTGKLVHFTRDSINAKITELGAKTASSVSKNTDYLITNEASGSSKYKKAIELNIPIITENEFLQMIREE